jgi:dihydropteroate synthase
MPSLRSLLPDLGRRVHVMGILNITPDSFSDAGVNLDPERALDRALGMMDEGADLIDVGGETTRPGSEPVALEVELGRVLPVIERLAARGVGPLSIDTTKAEVARRALGAGAALVNDISGGTFEPAIRAVAAEARAPMVLVHTRGRPKTMQAGAWTYAGGVVAAVSRALRSLAAEAEAAGVARESIALDPGIGFGKTLDENLALLAGLSGLKALGYPLLVGTSRKSFLGQLTGRDVRHREFATAATVALAARAGVDLVRVHEVGPMVDVVRVAEAVRRADALAKEGEAAPESPP